MSILVSRDRIDPQITSTDRTAEITQTSISDEEFNSELELIKSLEVVSSVVKELNLSTDQKPAQDGKIGEWRTAVKEAIFGLLRQPADENDSVAAAGFDKDVEKTVNRVVSNLSVVPIKNSRIIKVTYSDTDPVRAKKTLDAVYRKFVDLHVSLNERPEAGQVFDQQSGKFNRQLNEATDSLKNFDSRNGVIGADIGTQQSLLQKQLGDTQAQFNASQTQLGETVQKVASLKAKIAAEPEQIQTGYVSKYVPALDRIKDELLQLQQQRTQLLQKYQPNSRFVRENQERIEQLKKTLAAETANPPQERSYALNDLRRKLQSELHEAQTTLATLKDRENTLAGQVKKLTSEVLTLNTRSIERSGLERKRAINEEAYLLYEKKARENEIGQVLNKEQIMNFALVDAPRTDGEKTGPKPLLNFFILLGVGTMAGFAGALVLDRLSSRDFDDGLIHSRLEIEERLNLKLLASIPHIPNPGLHPPDRGQFRRRLPEFNIKSLRNTGD